MRLHLREVFTISRGSRTHVDNVLVKLEKDGITGYGEAGPNTRYEETAERVLEDIAELDAGIFDGVSSPAEIRELLEAQSFQTKSARTAAEMAWLDWWGKSQGQPLWKLLGFDHRTTPVTSFTIGIDEPEVMQHKVREAEQYPVLKVKLGTNRDREIIRAIRAVTNKPLRVDANEGWTSVAQAMREIEFLATQNVELVEQPMPAAMKQELRQLNKESSLPLCADESFTGTEDMEELAEAFDILNLKLMKFGSVSGALDAVEQAHGTGLRVMIGCMIESSLAISAGGLPALNAEFADLDGFLLIANDPFTGLHTTPEQRLQLSEQPGLGVYPK